LGVSIEVIICAVNKLSNGQRVIDGVLEVNRVSLDGILALLHFDDELVNFNEVLAVIVQLLLVVDAWSEENSDNALGILVGVDIDGDGELVGCEATLAGDDLELVVV
jgi:hypothetical protein